MRERAKRWLSRPELPWLAALVAVVLSGTALGNGFIADDHFLRGTSLGLHPPELSVATPWDLFRFYPADPRIIEAWRELGIAPWWMPLGFAVGFFRPVTSALHRIDFLLWPDSALWMHAHSLLWLAGTVFIVALLYRRFEARAWVAGLAALVFAMDDVHSIPAGWISNRSTVVATFFVALALFAHDRWRRDGWRAGAVLAPLALAFGLVSGEIALGMLGYFVAHAWVFERTLRDRVRALAPAVALVAVWRVAYVAMGYRTELSGLYIDPLRSPGPFALGLVERFPTLLFAQLGGWASDFYPLAPSGARRVLFLVSVAGSVLILVGFARLLSADRVARFWALGLGLALVPACATFPNDRLLFVASIGAAPLVARALGSVGMEVPQWFGAFLVLVHLVVSPLAMPWRVASMKAFGRVGERMVHALPRDLAGRTLVVVNMPDGLLCAQLITQTASQGVDPPHILRCVGVTTAALEVNRESERTLLLRPARSYFTAPMDGLLRAPELPWHVGDRVGTSVVSFEVTRLDGEGKPSELRAEFALPMGSDAIRMLTWDGHGLIAFVPPPVGESVRFPETSLIELMTGD